MSTKVQRTLFAVLLIALQYTGKAQVDPHFSQYYVYPLWLNPALTGSMEGNYRVSAIYRNQWAGISNPFSTAGVSADVSTSKDISLGINILNQTAGSAGYQYLNGDISVAYSGIKFGRQGQQHISFALKGGMISRRVDPSKFQGLNQWVPVIGYNSTIPVDDILAKPSSTVFDAGAGVSYYDGSLNKKVNFFAGFSADHITQPEDPFLSDGQKQKMPARYTIHGGARISMAGGSAFLVPNALYMVQGNATETMLGAYFQLPAGEVTDVMLGANYRFNDAVVPFAGIYYKNLMIGLSYDVNTSTLGNYTTANSFEVSVTFMGGNRSENKTFFKCPRL